MQSALTLRRPREDEEEEFLRAHRATSPEVQSFLPGHEEGMTLRRHLEILDQLERGITLPSPRHVPATCSFTFVGPRIVGRVSIRQALTADLERTGGHIGDVVVPEFRRRGYATAMLRLAFPVARDRYHTNRFLVTCDDDDIGPIRTIERNGGILENVVSGPDLTKPVRRYWIALRDEPEGLERHRRRN